ncbi:4-hydroxy-tetrahydrodipicolinate synthase [Paenibacillus endoradicis]|uniref:4-hydroxy-tetrahydrodipicolinate synthase n=1 Tax=Paenibacillus endoradicis TaxID=2972487 RepID=UPI00215937F6|nr:4-hydroxy-tetrahydrodipicolinate synthase [Paenibacillus endoradicis]MCR8656312.1 4-hydroxy-tetrahydrodipicolinate synthase [Paenibacillus endoradicis]
MEFGRLITAMVTPFDAEGTIDWATAEQLIEYLINDQQSDSIVIAGTTGESPTLTEDEKVELFTFAVEKAAGRVRIIAGTGSNNTKSSISLSQRAEQCGVDGLLLVVPYYNKPSQEGLYLHFKAIAENTSLPVFLYNVEGRTGTNLSVDTTLRLAQIPNIIATKDCANLDQLTSIISGAPEGFKVYSGDDSATLPALAVGAYGIISVSAHIVGQEMKSMIQSYISGNVTKAAKLHGELLPFFKGMFACPHPMSNPVPVKYALELIGIPVGSVRLPLAPITELEAEFVRNLKQIKNQIS